MTCSTPLPPFDAAQHERPVPPPLLRAHRWDSDNHGRPLCKTTVPAPHVVFDDDETDCPDCLRIIKGRKAAHAGWPGGGVPLPARVSRLEERADALVLLANAQGESISAVEGKLRDLEREANRTGGEDTRRERLNGLACLCALTSSAGTPSKNCNRCGGTGTPWRNPPPPPRPAAAGSPCVCSPGCASAAAVDHAHQALDAAKVDGADDKGEDLALSKRVELLVAARNTARLAADQAVAEWDVSRKALAASACPYFEDEWCPDAQFMITGLEAHLRDMTADRDGHRRDTEAALRGEKTATARAHLLMTQQDDALRTKGEAERARDGLLATLKLRTAEVEKFLRERDEARADYQRMTDEAESLRVSVGEARQETEHLHASMAAIGKGLIERERGGDGSARPCCERDHDKDGNCDKHPATASPRPTCGSLPCYRPGVVLGEGVCTRRNVGVKFTDPACVLAKDGGR